MECEATTGPSLGSVCACERKVQTKMLTGTSASVLILVHDALAILFACTVMTGTALSLYLFLLAAASLRRPVAVRAQDAPARRFAILIPAHEEELVIGSLLDS